jgi:hypothetical protein
MPAAGLAIESRISIPAALIGPPSLCWRTVRARSSLAVCRALRGRNSLIPLGKPAGSSLAGSRVALWRANPAGGGPLRHYRVSHLGTETAEDNLEVPGGDRRRAARLAGGLYVVLVVRVGDRPIVSTPPPTVRGVPLLLTGQGGTDPLPRPQPGMGEEEGPAERAPLPTMSPRDPGHEVTSAEETATATPRPRGEHAIRLLGG